LSCLGSEKTKKYVMLQSATAAEEIAIKPHSKLSIIFLVLFKSFFRNRRVFFIIYKLFEVV